jgi:hypothetical protein
MLFDILIPNGWEVIGNEKFYLEIIVPEIMHSSQIGICIS